ncbi:MAG: ABC-three component system protein [Polyangiaceae bacterium]
MKFAYEDLSPRQFEDLVVAMCQFILGAAVQGFAAGPDGGRDAKFVGTAELIPSNARPWNGVIVVQAKHTSGYNKTFSDTDFYSPENTETVLGKELPRVKKLRAAKDLDHYILFSNRRLTGNAESKLRGVIATECHLPESSVLLCGLEQIELWLRRFPQAATIANIDPIDSPLIVSPEDLAEVVEHLAEHLKNPAPSTVPPTDRVSYEQKNVLNNMSPEYAKELRRQFLKETPQIRTFLAAPENAELLKRYESAAEEFQLRILAKRKDYQSFDEVINYVVDLLLARDPILRANKRLTRTIVFYMYWNCDVGRSHDATTE